MTEFSIFVDRLNSINDEFAEGGTIADMKTQIDDNSARLDLYIAVNNKV